MKKISLFLSLVISFTFFSPVFASALSSSELGYEIFYENSTTEDFFNSLSPSETYLDTIQNIHNMASAITFSEPDLNQLFEKQRLYLMAFYDWGDSFATVWIESGSTLSYSSGSNFQYQYLYRGTRHFMFLLKRGGYSRYSKVDSLNNFNYVFAGLTGTNGFYYAPQINKPVEFSSAPLPPSLTDIMYYSKTLNIKSGFADWLIETERINQYSNIFSSVATKNIDKVVNFYSNYGGSALSFIFNFPSLANDISITSFSVDSIKELLSLLNYHYKEYLDYLSVRPTDIIKALQPYVTSTTPEPEEITPEVIQSSDSSDIVILKKILWYEMLILSSINNNTDRIVNSLDSISFDSNVDFSPLLAFSGVVNKPYYQEFQSNIDRLGCYDFSSVSVASASVASSSGDKPVPEIFQYSFFDDVEEAEDLTISFEMPNNFYVNKTVNGNFEYSTQMKTFELTMSDYPKLDAGIKTLRKFATFVMVVLFANSLRYSIPKIVRGE